MQRSLGEKLGPYEITDSLGVGGMGEVYRARDGRLGRDVAIKVSSEQFTDRFEREARAVAALNHPNICTLHDVGPNYLVMELVEGVTLAERIRNDGPIALDDALAIATQIADALEAAHDKGIIHRDLKPANIKVRDDGKVKVLDFGLAKLASLDGSQGGGVQGVSPADSPTVLETPSRIGSIVGTAAYMAPEQAKGKTVDKRADVWAFGVVLWEMVTGRRLFEGESISDTLGAVLKNEPDLTVVPRKIRGLLRACLEKDPKKRLHDIRDWQLVLEASAQEPGPLQLRRSWLPWVLATALAIGLATTFTLWLTRAAPDALRAQFSLTAPRGAEFVGDRAGVSPDGRFVVFAAAGASGRSLWVRPLDSLDARPIPGTENGELMCWSPDSRSIAFYELQRAGLKRVDIAGGAPQVLSASIANSMLGAGTWSQNGTILFGSRSGLYEVSASGGAPRVLAEPDASRQEDSLSTPQFLPDGRFLYSIRSVNPITQGVYVGSPQRPQERVRILATEGRAVYVPPQGGWPAYLVFERERTLMAQRIDPSTLRFVGDPIQIVGDLIASSATREIFWAANAGPLMYRLGSLDSNRRLMWIGREGTRTEAAPADRYQSFRLSPDGKDVALDADNGVEDIWRFEFARGVRTNLTVGGSRDVVPVWSPDGRQIAFMSDRTGVFQLYRKDARGGGTEEPLTEGPNAKFLTDWSRDGRHILYYEIAPGTEWDLWALALEGDRKPIKVLSTKANERNGVFSPDAKWIAYASDESGREEVYLQPFPSTGFRWPVSNKGGSRPRWGKDGKELFYLGPGRKAVMAADVRPTLSGIETTAPHQLFEFPWTLPELVSPYDVTADGQRFLALQPAEGVPAQLTVILNWQAGLKK